MPGQRLASARKRVEVEGAVRRVGDDGVRHAGFADQRGQRAGVDPGETDDAARLQPGVEPAVSAEVGRRAEVGPEDRADRGRGRSRIDDLDVLAIDADDPDMREREGDDLGRIGRIRQDLLVAGHRRVEADLADGRAGRPDAEALDHVAVREHQNAGRDRAAASRCPSRRPVRREFGRMLRLPCGCA